jgi:anti-sigma factor RsiW
MSTPSNIWPQDPGKGRLPEEQLMAYLEGRLSPGEQQEVEAWLAEEGMESDALEGLQELSASETRKTVSRLNQQLQHQLAGQKRSRGRYFRDDKWGWLAVIIVLLLVVLAYVVIRAIVQR